MQKILFVYNADQGKLNAAIDSLHKFISPGTYQCALCSLTHGAFGMKKDWQAFLAELDAEFEFIHRDEMTARFGSALTGTDLPIVVQQTTTDESSPHAASHKFTVLISAAQMQKMGDDAEQLKTAIRTAITATPANQE